MTWLRSAAYNLYFVLATVVYGLAALPVRMFARHRALSFATAWVGALLWGARVMCGIRYVVLGRENLPQGAALIASQHQSAFDTLVWLLIVPKVSYVFKAELARIPLFGPMLVPAGQIPLDRGGGFAAVKGLLRSAGQAVQAGRQIVVFPEGTRVAPGAEVELRPGITALAARTGLPIVPVATDSGRLWGRRAFRKTAGTIHLVIGPPLDVGQNQVATLTALRTAWRDAAARIPPCA